MSNLFMLGLILFGLAIICIILSVIMENGKTMFTASILILLMGIVCVTAGYPQTESETTIVSDSTTNKMINDENKAVFMAGVDLFFYDTLHTN